MKTTQMVEDPDFETRITEIDINMLELTILQVEGS